MIGLIKEILYKVEFTFFKKSGSKIGLSSEPARSGAFSVMQYLNINKGNRFTNLVSTISKTPGLAAYVNEFAPGHKNGRFQTLHDSGY